MYAFAPIAGYSAFGSFVGNGSSAGPFIYTGFAVRFLLVKRTDSTGSWFLLDNARDPLNPNSKGLFANLSNAEEDTANLNTDFNSNGFKIVSSDVGINASGGTYIYAAFGDSFKFSLAR
jgi:hypothetical protein